MTSSSDTETEIADTPPFDLKLVREFERFTGLKPRLGEAGKRYTTFSIGGQLSYLVEANSASELTSSLKFFAENGLNFRTIGFGSNLLIPDQGVSDWVLKLGPQFRNSRSISEDTFLVGASYPLMTLARELSNLGLSGLEFAGGIPGSLGGATFMNAGAHGGEIGNFIQEVRCITPSGEEHVYSEKELRFSYRKTNLPSNCIVTSVILKLAPTDPQKSQRALVENLEYRKSTQPLTMPSAGSVFRNPAPGMPAGQLIEQCGLKGSACGSALVSKMHANWIVNPRKSAKAEDVLGLISQCQSSVLEKFKVSLEPEIVLW